MPRRTVQLLTRWSPPRQFNAHDNEMKVILLESMPVYDTAISPM